MESMSKKVETLITNNPIQPELMLPKAKYEPFFMKVMNDFIKHHNLPGDIAKPQGSMMPHKIFSYIVELMAHSMGEEKRKELIVELNDYKNGLPFDLR